MSGYALLFNDKTTGLDTIGPDINAYNSYGMTPLQVAFQAGAVSEAREILKHPDIDAGKLSKTGASPEFYIAMHEQSESSGVRSNAEVLRQMLNATAILNRLPIPS